MVLGGEGKVEEGGDVNDGVGGLAVVDAVGEDELVLVEEGKAGDELYGFALGGVSRGWYAEGGARLYESEGRVFFEEDEVVEVGVAVGRCSDLVAAVGGHGAIEVDVAEGHSDAGASGADAARGAVVVEQGVVGSLDASLAVASLLLVVL